MAHVLVTGGAGFIGSHFVDYWLKKYSEDQITIIDSLDTAGVFDNIVRNQKKYPERCLFIKADITDYPAMDRIFQARQFDTVINFAAISSQDRALRTPHDCQRINFGGVTILFECARVHKVKRFHQVSTCEVYGPLTEGIQSFTENSPLNPRSPYNTFKAEADKFLLRACRDQKTVVTISRSCNNYGPYQYLEKLIPRAITNLLCGEKIVLAVDGSHRREWIHVLDCVRALDVILHKGRNGEVYNVGTGEEADLNQIAGTILSKLKRDAATWREYGPDRTLNNARYLLDSTKLWSHGWKPQVTLESRHGLSETIKWYVNHGEWWAPLRRDMLERRDMRPRGSLRDFAIESAHVLHEDPRRRIYGVSLNVEQIDEDYTSTVDTKIIDIDASNDSPVILGEHYHDTAEVLYIIDGEVQTCTLEDVATQEQTVLRNLAHHTKLYIPPRVAHRLRFVQPTRLLYLNEENHVSGKTSKTYKISHITEVS